MKSIYKTTALLLILALFAALAMGSGSDSGDTQSPSSASGEKKEAETVEEQVLFEKDGLRITLKGLSLNGLLGPSLKLLVENDGEKTLTVSARDTTVNGYMTDILMSCEVAPGKKSNYDATISKSDLSAAGIDVIADVELSFHIYNSEKWTDAFDSERISIKTSAAPGFVYTYDDSGSTVYEKDGLKIVVKGLNKSSLLGPSVVLYIANTGDKDVTVQSRDVSVNGFMVSDVFSAEILKGKHAVDSITLLSSSLKENGIESVDEVELSFHIFDSSSFKTIEDTPPIKISFNN
ncbi:MAG: hypothetical protein II794_06280 [Oscillospiraceae bacterium]|nr:hypothetical protein [Oscillospiraceae bacterium]